MPELRHILCGTLWLSPLVVKLLQARTAHLEHPGQLHLYSVHQGSDLAFELLHDPLWRAGSAGSGLELPLPLAHFLQPRIGGLQEHSLLLAPSDLLVIVLLRQAEGLGGLEHLRKARLLVVDPPEAVDTLYKKPPLLFELLDVATQLIWPSVGVGKLIHRLVHPLELRLELLVDMHVLHEVLVLEVVLRNLDGRQVPRKIRSLLQLRQPLEDPVENVVDCVSLALQQALPELLSRFRAIVGQLELHQPQKGHGARDACLRILRLRIDIMLRIEFTQHHPEHLWPQVDA
eukprot:scaffold438_cov250-Pinguiococcus_pyrenoidosus.AAC.44